MQKRALHGGALFRVRDSACRTFLNACWLDEAQEADTVALSQFGEGLPEGLLITWLTDMPCPRHQHDQRAEL